MNFGTLKLIWQNSIPTKYCPTYLTKFNSIEVRSNLFHKSHSDKVCSNLFDKIQFRRSTVKLIWQNSILTKYAQTYFTKFIAIKVRSNLFDKIQYRRSTVQLIWQNSYWRSMLKLISQISIPTKYGPTYLTKFNTDKVWWNLFHKIHSDKVRSNLFDKIQYWQSTVQLIWQNSISTK